MSVAAVVVAAGRGERFGTELPKQFVSLKGKPVLSYCVETFLSHPLVREVIVVVPKSYLELTESLVEKASKGEKELRVVSGGETRAESVKNGLKAVKEGIEFVLVHDGVRPFVSQALVTRVIEVTKRHGAAICAVPVKETVKRVKGEFVEETVPREGLWLAQTPQGARLEWLLEAFSRLEASRFTDEASMLEAVGRKVAVVEGSPFNIKITYPQDLSLVEALLERFNPRE